MLDFRCAYPHEQDLKGKSKGDVGSVAYERHFVCLDEFGRHGQAHLRDKTEEGRNCPNLNTVKLK